MLKIFFASILFISIPGLAVVSNVSILSGASEVVGQPIVEVQGAMIGHSDSSQTQPYDNCHLRQRSIEVCHPLRVNGDHIITIEFIETSDLIQPVAPIAIVRQNYGHGNVQPYLLSAVDLSQSRIGSNQPGKVSFRWSDVCKALNDYSGERGRIENNRCVDSNGRALSGYINVTIGFQSHPGVADTDSVTSIGFYLYSL